MSPRPCSRSASAASATTEAARSGRFSARTGAFGSAAVTRKVIPVPSPSSASCQAKSMSGTWHDITTRPFARSVRMLCGIGKSGMPSGHTVYSWRAVGVDPDGLHAHPPLRGARRVEQQLPDVLDRRLRRARQRVTRHPASSSASSPTTRGPARRPPARSTSWSPRRPRRRAPSATPRRRCAGSRVRSGGRARSGRPARRGRAGRGAVRGKPAAAGGDPKGAPVGRRARRRCRRAAAPAAPGHDKATSAACLAALTVG